MVGANAAALNGVMGAVGWASDAVRVESRIVFGDTWSGGVEETVQSVDFVAETSKREAKVRTTAYRNEKWLRRAVCRDATILTALARQGHKVHQSCL
jgi:hypothetical protein